MYTIWTVLAATAVLVTNCIADQTASLRDINDNGPLSPDKFLYYERLDDGYELRWNFNSTHIIFQTRVKTTGYIGFGISEHGSMFPADVIIAWVKDGKVHFKDRHATGHFTPAVDTSQDWHLVKGSEDGQYTTITMVRLLDTCDKDDIAISAGTSRVIYSYSPSDPDSHDNIHYHGFSRGTKSVLLLDPKANENTENSLPADVTTIDFLNFNYSVPSTDTTYSCSIHKLPPLKGKHHVIRFEPVLQKGHEKRLHHMLLYYCKDSINEHLVGTQYMCYEGNTPAGVSENCEHAFVAWAIGGKAFDFPINTGFSMGDSDDPVYFRLETHYDNPQMESGLVDNSGLRLYLTRQLRQHDAGMLTVGLAANPAQIIPPHETAFVSQGYCVQDCVDEALGDSEIHVFGNMLHAHLLGRKITTRHIRNGTELAPILQDNSYDFNYQQGRLLQNERTIKKGDTISTECVYDSTGKTNVTFGGLSTRHEMCISFLMYYPKKPLSLCFSLPNYNLNGRTEKNIWQVLRTMDFTKKSVRQTFRDMMNDDYVTSLCLTQDKYKFRRSTIPSVAQPYVPESPCSKP